MEASLDAFPGLLEGLPLGALSGVVSAHSHDVGAREDQHIRHDLSKTVRQGWNQHPQKLKLKGGVSHSLSVSITTINPYSRLLSWKCCFEYLLSSQQLRCCILRSRQRIRLRRIQSSGAEAQRCHSLRRWSRKWRPAAGQSQSCILLVAPFNGLNRAAETRSHQKLLRCWDKRCESATGSHRENVSWNPEAESYCPKARRRDTHLQRSVPANAARITGTLQISAIIT